MRPDVMNLNDAVMLEPCDRFRFPSKPQERAVIGTDVTTNHFQSAETLERLMTGEIDNPHSAAAELRPNDVAPELVHRGHVTTWPSGHSGHTISRSTWPSGLLQPRLDEPAPYFPPTIPFSSNHP